ncbi:unnamed protein product [Urochloa decumbens]|uniref:Ubiquitin-like protease family profile domain-containing protein n=1 Tax=Urochloa decumbens TaxID=240449 RepID=A0ABC9B4J7_9POAL
MAKQRPPDWMPVFPEAGRHRPPHPASSAPTFRSSSRAASSVSSPVSSGDEGPSIGHITNRCSPKAVYLVISKFNEFKKQRVRDMGFGGILDLPCITKVNLKLSVWLLTKLDTEESALVFSETKRIWIHERDVGIVFGIPDGDLDISSVEITHSQIELIRQLCGLCSKDSRSFKGLEHVLEEPLDENSSTHEIDRFMVAFVIFVMGHLLAPTTKHDHCNGDFWAALKDPEKIYRFNWCRYVYWHVLESARRVRDEIVRKGNVSQLTGCHLFLQILFLDNVDLRGMNKPHNIVPRVKLFDADSLKKMAFMCEGRDANDFSAFIGIRCKESCAYMRHSYQTPRSTTDQPAHRTPPMMTAQAQSATPSLPSYSNAMSPETFQLNQASDLASYIRLKHPGLVRTYAMDYIKMHTGHLLQELARMRIAILKRSAGLVDWLAEHVGSNQLQLIHKRPSSSMNATAVSLPCNVVSAVKRSRSEEVCTPQTTVNEDVAESPAAKKPSIVAATFANLNKSAEEPGKTHRQKISPVVKRSRIEEVCTPQRTVTEDVAESPAGNNLSIPAGTLAKLNKCSEEPGQTKRQKFSSDPIPGIRDTTHAKCTPKSGMDNTMTMSKFSGPEPPSFDLGIDQSPVAPSFITPKGQVFHIQPITSPVPFDKSSPPHQAASSSTVQASPRQSTVQQTYDVVIDYVDFFEDSIDPAGKVMYQQMIPEGYEKISIPASPDQLPSWLECQCHPTPDPVSVAIVHAWCTNASSADCHRPWIIHPLPRYLLLPGTELKDNLLGDKFIHHDIIDVLLRRFNQLDISTSCPISIRWRHFFESSFSLQSIAGFQPEQFQSVLNQFVGLDHSIAHCSMLVVPLIVDGFWCAHMINMSTTQVHFLDPGYSVQRRQLHEHFFKIVHGALAACVENFFQDWSLNPSDEWDMHYPQLCSSAFSSADSGICMLHFARYFNGQDLEATINEAMIQDIRRCFLYEALSIGRNEAQLPDKLKALMD